MHPNRLPTKPTTSLKCHLSKCKEHLCSQQHESNAPSLSTLTHYWENHKSVQNQRANKTVTKSMLEEEILKFVISANLPFNQVENEHFQRLISWIQVNQCPAQAPSHKVIWTRLSSKSELSKENLRKTLSANS